MFFSKVAVLAALSLVTSTLVSAQGSSYGYGDIYARDASLDSYGYLGARDADLYDDIYARDAFPEPEAELFERKKGAKVTVSLDKKKGGDKNKWGTSKTHETEADAKNLVEDACDKHGWKAAVIT